MPHAVSSGVETAGNCSEQLRALWGSFGSPRAVPGEARNCPEVPETQPGTARNCPRTARTA
eukprot:5693886-Alexandrium_andersonii.AAC.1